MTAALAILAKPSALPAVAGLALALLVKPRGDWKRDWAALAVGGVVALGWDAWQAHEIGTGFVSFLQGADSDLAEGVVSYYQQLNAQSRASFILGAGWVGPYLLLLLLFGLVYGAGRALPGWTHRRAATVAAPAAIAGAVLLPFVAGGDVGPFDYAKPVALVGSVLLIVPLWWSRDCPEEAAPSRPHLLRMLIWAVPPAVAWIVSAPFQTRYLSPAWAPLFVLMAAATWTVVRGTMQRRNGRELALGVVAVLCVMAIFDLRNLDGLGARTDGTINAASAVRELGVTGWFDRDRAERAADPDLAALHAAVDQAMARPGRLVTLDGRVGFWYPQRTVRAEAQRAPPCAASRRSSSCSPPSASTRSTSASSPRPSAPRPPAATRPTPRSGSAAVTRAWRSSRSGPGSSRSSRCGGERTAPADRGGAHGGLPARHRGDRLPDDDHHRAHARARGGRRLHRRAVAAARARRRLLAGPRERHRLERRRGPVVAARRVRPDPGRRRGDGDDRRRPRRRPAAADAGRVRRPVGRPRRRRRGRAALPHLLAVRRAG